MSAVIVIKDSEPQKSSVLEQLGKSLQVERPTIVAADGVAFRLPALTMPVEIAVLELDTRPLGALGDEANLDLAGALGIGLDLPPRADIPADHHAIRRF